MHDPGPNDLSDLHLRSCSADGTGGVNGFPKSPRIQSLKMQKAQKTVVTGGLIRYNYNITTLTQSY